MLLNKKMGIQKIFIENLRYFRKQKGMSQKDLSIILDKGFNYINSIEGGSSFPPPAVIDQIAEVLEVTPSSLFSENLNPDSIKESFKHHYSMSLKEMLHKKISEAIDSVCDSIDKQL